VFLLNLHSDEDSAPWWDALKRHEFVLQRCDACGILRWPPRDICNRCGSLNSRWVADSGAGTVASWVVTRHPFLPGVATPYTTLLVRLDAQRDLVIPGAYDGPADGSDLAFDQQVELEFYDIQPPDGPAYTLLRWCQAPAT
jgi:uncharacterized protein